MEHQLEQIREQTIPENFINEKETRALALVVFICCVSFFLTSSILIFWFLIIEFALRVFTNIKYTPVKLLNNFVLPLLKIRPGLIPIAPKKLAATLGMIFCICILTAQYLNNITMTNIFVGCMTFFSFLEFSISFCVATIIYNTVVKWQKTK